MQTNDYRPATFLDEVAAFGFGISTESSIPLYYQLYLILKRAIREHALRRGDRFPAEEAIAEHFSVSRPTANRAVQELIDQGWLSRQRGRGTFVVGIVSTQLSLLNNSLSFSDEIGRHSEYRTEFMTRTLIVANSEDAKALQITPGDSLCYFRRLHMIGERIVRVCDSKLPADRFPKLVETAFVRHSLFETLRETFACEVREAERCAEAAEILDVEVAELLGIPLFAPILLLTGLAFDETHCPVEAMSAYVREGVSFKNRIVGREQKPKGTSGEACPKTHAPVSDPLCAIRPDLTQRPT